MTLQQHLGFGVGLRTVHFEELLGDVPPAVDWLELISENFMFTAGRPRAVARRLAERYPLVLHGVSLSPGSTDPLDWEYLGRLKQLASELQPRWVSDHVCWTGVLGTNTHDLLPLPYHEESLRHLAQRVNQIQDFLQRPLVLENPSTYLTFQASTLSEPEFLTALVGETGCELLLDVNNVYVSCFNHGLDPREYLRGVPMHAVRQMHLAGHTHCGTHLIDTHDGPVIEAVWELYREAQSLTGGTATLIEWDAQIPTLSVVQAEAERARQVATASPSLAVTDVPVATETPSSQRPQSIPQPGHWVAALAE